MTETIRTALKSAVMGPRSYSVGCATFDDPEDGPFGLVALGSTALSALPSLVRRADVRRADQDKPGVFALYGACAVAFLVIVGG